MTPESTQKPMPKTKVTICPYCGETQPAQERCRACGGYFDALSRQATHNAMGPWWIRNPERPNQPGCSYETMIRLIERGQVTKYSILRGPTTRQFWTVARHVPGIAHLLGFCHACDTTVDPDDHGCPNCGVPFGAYLDRSYLGLPEVRALPGEAPDDEHHEQPSGRPSWTMPTMSPRGLSSFAGDDELLGRSASSRTSFTEISDSPEAATGDESAEAESSGDVAVAHRHRAGAPVTSEPAIEVRAVRVLQRRIAQQQRTIRMLMALVAAVALIGAFISLAQLSASGESESSGSPGESPGEVQRDTNAEVPAAEDAAPSAQNAPEVKSNPPAENEAVNALDSDNHESNADQLEAAETLLIEGRDEMRSIAVRIARYEAALAILRALKESSSNDAELEEKIRSAEDALEDLRLREFFQSETGANEPQP